MDGILYVLDELGRGMAQLKAEMARLAQENAELRAQSTGSGHRGADQADQPSAS